MQQESEKLLLILQSTVEKAARLRPFKVKVKKLRSILTKGNGSGSSLVKELKCYDEEGIRRTQHRLKSQELLE